MLSSAAAKPEEIISYYFAIEEKNPQNSFDFRLETNTASIAEAILSQIQNNACGTFTNLSKELMGNVHDLYYNLYSTYSNCGDKFANLYGETDYAYEDYRTKPLIACIKSLIDAVNIRTNSDFKTVSYADFDKAIISSISALTLIFIIGSLSLIHYKKNKSIENKKTFTERLDAIKVDAANDPLAENFICPISHDIMDYPVIANDERSYDKNFIDGWLKSGNKLSPINPSIKIKTITPNHHLKDLIEAYVAKKEREHNAKQTWYQRLGFSKR